MAWILETDVGWQLYNKLIREQATFQKKNNSKGRSPIRTRCLVSQDPLFNACSVKSMHARSELNCLFMLRHKCIIADGTHVII